MFFASDAVNPAAGDNSILLLLSSLPTQDWDTPLTSSEVPQQSVQTLNVFFSSCLSFPPFVAVESSSTLFLELLRCDLHPDDLPLDWISFSLGSLVDVIRWSLALLFAVVSIDRLLPVPHEETSSNFRGTLLQPLWMLEKWLERRRGKGDHHSDTDFKWNKRGSQIRRGRDTSCNAYFCYVVVLLPAKSRILFTSIRSSPSSTETAS